MRWIAQSPAVDLLVFMKLKLHDSNKKVQATEWPSWSPALCFHCQTSSTPRFRATLRWGQTGTVYLAK